ADLEEPGEQLHRPTACVHKALRHEKPGTARLVAADQRLELRILAQRHALGGRKPFHQPEPGVVASALVLLARVPQADHQADQSYFFSFFSPSVASPSFGACSVVGTSAAATGSA